MRAWFACTGAELLARDPADVVGRLASAQQGRGFSGSPEQEAAWRSQVVTLCAALAQHDCADWHIALEYDLLRLEKRIDAVILTDRAILCLEFKLNDRSPAALAEAEDYALDLRDFHAGSRTHPIVPILVTGGAPFPLPQPSLLLDAVWQPIPCIPAQLADTIAHIQRQALPKPLDGAAWLAAPYRPVPQIIEAATMLFARHGVAEIAAAGADRASLTRTSQAIADGIEAARQSGERVVIFVTGVPGAGKTLCGLNTVFGAARADGAAFLTGNMPLVAVLRAALAQDAIGREKLPRAEAERRVKTALQNVHRFLEDGAGGTGFPPERVIVFDEAQRAWDEAKAIRGSQNRPSRLSMSEPAHCLEIMSRRPGWAVVVALIGQGQEINTGEAGVQEWGQVIPRFGWRALAAPGALPSAPWLRENPDLALTIPIRSLRSEATAAWVDAVLRGEAAEARAMGEQPFFLTRSLDAMRHSLRAAARGTRRAGLLRSSGAKRLRAEGLAAEVSADEVPNWFLMRWPDVRASDALEAAATEYACQGLELDLAGLAWGGDFLRTRGAWAARRFIGTAWQADRKEFHFVRNTYRVLLTRARAETIIWVPPGDPADPTRPPAEMDAIADFLAACGARPLQPAAHAPQPVPALL
ncbi:DNA/RNA helicase domain-containing protein [Rhodovarius lipocyclicus]|uniref:DNA/RNA helicase domain-containing protein n=1 Tax=Rhodovarius lipocyclicus TaxID=268410 RepID=UPI00135A32E9|nr:DNA/RNA helicase domain-containing protein [Rhodovarius lipocyclicus]